MTVNQIVKRLQTIIQSHQMVRSYFYGNPNNFLTEKQRDYPAAILQDASGSFLPAGNEFNMPFRLFILDLVNVAADAKENELEVQSDALSIAKDLVALFDSPEYDDWAVGRQVSFSLVAEKFEDMLGGVYIDFTIRTTWDKSYCEAPTT